MGCFGSKTSKANKGSMNPLKVASKQLQGPLKRKIHQGPSKRKLVPPMESSRASPAKILTKFLQQTQGLNADSPRSIGLLLNLKAVYSLWPSKSSQMLLPILLYNLSLPCTRPLFRFKQIITNTRFRISPWTTRCPLCTITLYSHKANQKNHWRNWHPSQNPSKPNPLSKKQLLPNNKWIQMRCWNLCRSKSINLPS